MKQDAAEYDKENPEVWTYFIRFALEAINSGWKRIGSKAIFERIRWETQIQGKPFKVNNNYTPYYARKFEATFPEFGEVFGKRGLKE